MELSELELQKKIDDAISGAVSGLQSKNSEILAKLSTAKQELADAEKKKADDIEASEQARLESEGKSEELIQRIRDSHKTEVESLNTKIAELTTSSSKAVTDLRTLMVDQGLATAYLTAGVSNPHLHKSIVASTALVAVIEDDAEGKPTVMIGGKPMDEYITAWKDTDEGKSFIMSGNSGGGSGSDNNSGTDEWESFFKPESVNLTKQNELRVKDPARYDALVKQYAKEVNLPLSANQRGY